MPHPEFSALLPSVSVVVPVFEPAETLGHCLDALAKQTYPASRLEIIVVDNGARVDVEKKVRRFPGVRLEREGLPGSYAARNKGIETATGEILAFTDADCLPSADWIERGVRALRENRGRNAVAGRVIVIPRDPVRMTSVELHQVVRCFPQRFHVETLKFGTTANLFVHRAAFDRVGLFEARLLSGGDAEWCQRHHAAGGGAIYAEDVLVYHPARRTFRGILRQRRRTVGGRHARSRGVGHPPMSLDDPRASYAWPRDRIRHYASHDLLRSRWNRLRFAAVEYFLYAVTRLEMARLRLGGSPRR